MPTSRLSPQGQVTLPKEVLKKIGLQPGDLVAYEVENGHITMTRAEPSDMAFHTALVTTLTEWDSPEDHEAFDDL